MKKRNIAIVIIIIIVVIACIEIGLFIKSRSEKSMYINPNRDISTTYIPSEESNTIIVVIENNNIYKNENLSTQNEIELYVANETKVNSSTKNQNTSQTESYIPNVINTPENLITPPEIIDLPRSKDKVSIKVIQNKVSPTGASILITDKNENKYEWEERYRIEIKTNGSWNALKANANASFTSLAYNPDENGQLTMNINWTQVYGELPKGTYRIVKSIYDKGYIDFYSDEFQIN